MLTRRNNSRRNCLRLSSRFNEMNGRHVGTRTPDLYRVNFEVSNPKPFACLAFLRTTYLKTPRKQPIFGDELVTSFCKPKFLAFPASRVLAHGVDTQLTRVKAS